MVKQVGADELSKNQGWKIVRDLRRWQVKRSENSGIDSDYLLFTRSSVPLTIVYGMCVIFGLVSHLAK